MKIDSDLSKAAADKARGNRSGALAHLKRKVQYEKMKHDLENQLANLEEQRITLQSVRSTVDNVKAMQLGARALQELHQEVSGDDAQDTLIDIQLHMEETRKFVRTVSSPMTQGATDAELLAELDELGEQDDEQVVAQPTRVAASAQTSAPAISATRIAALSRNPVKSNEIQLEEEETEEDAAFEKLHAEMAQ